MFTRITFSLGILAMLVGISCDRVPLLAPTNSSVTLDAGTRVLETGASTTLSAMVIESSGTPVQNGTTVRFTTTLGRVDPAEAQTRNGVATTTFFAGDASGVAEVRATSGGAGGGSTTPTTPPSDGNGGTTSTPTNSNVVMISVGAGAVQRVTLRANPSTVSKTQNTAVTVIATVVGANGRLLSGIPVNFSANRGTFSSNSAVTDAQGEARVTVTTNDTTTVTATAGSAEAATVEITGQDGPSVTLACAVGTGGTCSSVSPGQSVTFTAERGDATSAIASSSLDFGDGSNPISLGPLSSAVTVPHVYSQAGTYTARLTATDLNGETTSDVEIVQVTSATLTVTATNNALAVTATASTSNQVSQYQWNFGDGFTATTTGNSEAHTYAAGGTYTIQVTALLTGGGSVSGSTQITIP